MEEMKNMYGKIETVANELCKNVNSLLTEVNYLKLSASQKNELNILGSSAILATRFSDLSITLIKLISINVDILREVKIPSDTGKVLRKQINDANAMIIQLSNSMANYIYFVAQNLIE